MKLRPLFWFCMLSSFIAPASMPAQDAAALDKAMQQYIRAIVEKDAELFLSLVPRDKPFVFASYEIGTTKKANSTEITLEKLAAEFKAKDGEYYTFFGDYNGYTYRLTVVETPFKKWKKEGETFRSPGDAVSYVRWRTEEGRWVLDEIGDTSP